MRNRLVIALLSAAAAGGLAHGTPTAGDWPSAALSNGFVRLVSYLPAASNAYYQAVRFDHASLLGEIDVGGHRFLIPHQNGAHNPKGHDHVAGPAEEFDLETPPPGYAQAPAGGPFLKVGVGVLRRPDAKPYSFGRFYELLDAGVWSVAPSGGTSIVFRQTVATPDGRWGYVYERRVSLPPAAARIHIERRLRNTGSQPLVTRHYSHNFTQIDGQPIGTNYVIELPFTPQPLGQFPAEGWIGAGQLGFVPAALSRTFWTRVCGFGVTAADNHAVVRYRPTGAAVGFTTDLPLADFRVYGNARIICPEAFVDLMIAPGAETVWRTEIAFELPAVPGQSEKSMQINRKDGQVWIDVAGFDAGQMASSVHGAQARILQTIGEPLTYEQLICYGGLAFRIGVHKAMCPSAAHPCCGFMCIENSNRALPWQTRFFSAGSRDKSSADREAFEREARAAIRQSIDRGVPVHYGSEEDGLIIGYADEGRRWLCLHPYHKNGTERFWHDEAKGMAGGGWPWGIEVWTAPKPAAERVPPRELARAALKQAAEMWRTEKRGDYFVGDAAYGHWLNWLREVDAGRTADPKAGMQGNGWCYDTLVHYRRIAAAWLRQIAPEYDGDARKELLAAADTCGKLVDGCMDGLKCTWDLALPPNRSGDWTPELRQDQIRRLEAARELDRAAIAAIERALASM